MVGGLSMNPDEKIRAARVRYLQAAVEYRRTREITEQTLQQAEHEFSQAMAELFHEEGDQRP